MINPSSRLTNPASYHIQQMRFKEQQLNPPQMIDNPHIIFAQQQKESSPNLSDLDYSELTTTSSVSGIAATDLPPRSPTTLHNRLSHIPHDPQEYLYDHQQYYDRNKRLSSSSSGIAEYNNMMYFSPSPSSSIDQRYYYKSSGPFASVSAPANIGHSHMVGDSVPTTTTAEQGAAAMNSNNRFVATHDYHQRPFDQYQAAMMSGRTTAVDKNEAYEDDFAAQANLQAIMEKRRRRRESHNAVERRRRDNINERIQELGTLLPESMTAEEGGVARLNKGTILRKSVEQIRMLQRDLREYQQRVQELEEMLRELGRQNLKTHRSQQRQA